jgi:NADH-quinone oxidoreductase subunit E
VIVGEQIEEKTAQLLKSYQGHRGELIPILQEAQSTFGYLPREAMLMIARFMRIPESSVYGVATFYNQFRFSPLGRHPLKVCMGTACHMKGGQLILEAWERDLSIKVGETSSDGEFSIERVACVGCCAMAPVTVIAEEVHGKVTPTRVRGLVESFKREKDKEDNTD